MQKIKEFLKAKACKWFDLVPNDPDLVKIKPDDKKSLVHIIVDHEIANSMVNDTIEIIKKKGFASEHLRVKRIMDILTKPRIKDPKIIGFVFRMLEPEIEKSLQNKKIPDAITEILKYCDHVLLNKPADDINRD